VVSGVTEHLHFGFHEFTELSTDEFKARLTELNLLWLVKLVQAHPELSVDELRMRFFLDTFPADSGYSARKNPMSFKSHISEKGIIRYYVPDEDLPYIVKKTNYELRNHFELRSHFADPVTEIEEVIRWMEMSDEEFRLQVIRTAREMFSIDQSLEKKIQQCDPGVITTLLTRGWLTEPTPCKK
ncbi:MAG: hypothetical protein JWQ35_1381, partial [Bacteriovoracaceae bacterium]|nr:hypothetical protein [Bacteriovoracaceae bacterium]